jgi:hypothetical protein
MKEMEGAADVLMVADPTTFRGCRGRARMADVRSVFLR